MRGPKEQINLQKMMRKNKFVNSNQKVSDRENWPRSPDSKDRNHPLMQNKIYFPSSYQDTLMPYKIQSVNQKNPMNFGKVQSNQLYDIKQRRRSKQANQRKISFGRENKFEKVQNRQKPDTGTKNNGFLKYNTIELKNLPGISYTMSGATIYRSKNIKSSGKLLIDRSISKRGKSQVRRNLSLRNDESVQNGIPKSKSNKQTNLKQIDKSFILYQTYFSSKSGLNLRSNSSRPFQDGDFIEEGNQEIVESPQSDLLAKVIQSELYACQIGIQQQFF